MLLIESYFLDGYMYRKSCANLEGHYEKISTCLALVFSRNIPFLCAGKNCIEDFGRT